MFGERLDKARAGKDPVGFARWQRMVGIVEPIEKRMVKAINKVAVKEEKELLAVLNKDWRRMTKQEEVLLTSAERKRMLDDLSKVLGQEADWMMDDLSPDVNSALLGGGDYGAGDVISGFDFDLENPHVKEYKKEFGKRIKGVQDTSLASFQKNFTKGLMANEGLDKLTERITKHVGKFPSYRSDTIARTEAMSAFSFGTQESYEQANIDGTKYWHDAGDDNVRPDHQNVAPVKGRNTPFMVGGAAMLYPHDPAGGAENIINCRCCHTVYPTARVRLPEGRKVSGDVVQMRRKQSLKDRMAKVKGATFLKLPVSSIKAVEFPTVAFNKEAKKRYGVKFMMEGYHQEKAQIVLNCLEQIKQKKMKGTLVGKLRKKPLKIYCSVRKMPAAKQGWDVQGVYNKKTHTMHLSTDLSTKTGRRNTIDWVFEHEYGHHYHNVAMSSRSEDKWLDLLFSGEKPITKYAAESYAENIAESFAAYLRNPMLLKAKGPEAYKLIQGAFGG